MTNERRRRESEFTYDVSGDESLSEGVVAAISAVSGADPSPGTPTGTEEGDHLEPLYTAVEPDALDRLFRATASDLPRPSGRITFTYCGHEVTVRSDGRISVEPATGGTTND